MSWKMREQEFNNAIKLTAEERYEYTIKKAADWQEIWGLWNEGWVLYGAKDEKECMPIWPHERFADACRGDDWSDCAPKMIELSHWMEKWIPELIQEQRLVAVFPIPNGKSIVIEPNELQEHLQKELDRYE